MKVTVNGHEYILLTKCPLLETTERYEFKTDVHQSFDASSEERIPLLDAARQSFNYSMLAYKAEIQGMFDTFYDELRAEYLIPQMLETVTVSDIDGDFIDCDTSLLNVGVDSFILVKSNNTFAAVQVTEIGRYEVIEEVPTYFDGFRIHTAIEATSPILQPLRLCIIDGDMTAQMNALVFKPQVTFRVLENIEYPISAAPEQFNSEDYYDWKVLLNGDYLDVSFSQHQNIVDGGMGNIWGYTHWMGAKKMFVLRLLMRNPQEYIDLKKWFYRRRGRLNAFYLQMFEGDKNNPVKRLFRLNSDAIEFNFKGAGIVETNVPVVELTP